MDNKQYDPVHQKNDSWYFWDETQTERYGPFRTEHEARSECERYCQFLNRAPAASEIKDALRTSLATKEDGDE